MKTRRAKLLLVSIAGAVALTAFPSSAADQPAMMCSDPLEPVCLAIAVACNTADTLEAKILKGKDLINCRLG